MLKNDSEEMDTSINHSTVSVPVTSERIPQASHYRKRLLQKYRQEQLELEAFKSTTSSTTTAENTATPEKVYNGLYAQEPSLVTPSKPAQPVSLFLTF